MSKRQRIWYFAVLFVTVLTVALGYLIGIAPAAIFWIIGTSVLLVLRPD